MAWNHFSVSVLKADTPVWVSDGSSIFEASWLTQESGQGVVEGVFKSSSSGLPVRVTHIWNESSKPLHLPEEPKNEAEIVEEELRKREG